MKPIRVRLSVFVVAALAIAGTSGWATAQDASKDAVASRKDHFHQIGTAFKAVNDEMHAGTTNWQTIRSNAAMLAQLTSEIPSWFPAGSGPESGAKTRAKAEIWAKGSNFQEDARLAHVAAQDLLKTTAGNDLSAVTNSVKALGTRCASCHSEFREKE